MNKASFLQRKVSQSGQLFRDCTTVNVYVFIHFMFSQDAMLCFDSFYTAKSHKSSRREASTSSSDSQCGHRGGIPDLGEISKGFFPWPQYGQILASGIHKPKKPCRKIKGNKDKVKDYIRWNSFSQLQCIVFVRSKLKYNEFHMINYFRGKKKKSMLPVCTLLLIN